MMQPAEVSSPTLLSYAVPLWTTLHRATGHYWATIELRCNLLSYAEPYSAMLNPTELRWILLSYAVPYWDTFSTWTFVQFCQTPECQTVLLLLHRNKGTPVRYRNATVPDWDAGCRNTDAGGIGLDADAQLCKLRGHFLCPSLYKAYSEKNKEVNHVKIKKIPSNRVISALEGKFGRVG
jgi:hypothetical protein